MKITALIPAYNVEKYIKRSIDSALNQTFKPFEILVIDDGSTDNTRNIVESYGDKVTYIYKKNGGSSSARNLGIELAKGEWIAFLDSDDQWEKIHLENFVKVIKQKPDLMWYGAPVRHIEEKTGKTLFEYDEKTNNDLLDGLYFKNYLSALPPAGFFSTPTMVIKKEVFKNVGLFNTDLKIGEDIELWFRIGLLYPEIGYCTTIGVNVYKRNNSLSHAKKWNPSLALNRFADCELLAKNLGNEFAKRAEPRIIYWVTKLIKSALKHRDFKTLNQIKKKYLTRLPLKYKMVVLLSSLLVFYKMKKVNNE